MGKKANERIDKIFTELAANGKLQKPLYTTRQRRAKPLTPVRVKKAESVCCLIKYENNLPMGFRPCYGCPLTPQPPGRKIRVPNR
jgi:hypothetical protein